MGFKKILEALSQKSLEAAYKAHFGKDPAEEAGAKTLIEEMVADLGEEGKNIAVSAEGLKTAIKEATKEMGEKQSDLIAAQKTLETKLETLSAQKTASEDPETKYYEMIGASVKAMMKGDGKTLLALQESAVKSGLLGKKDLSGQTGADGGHLIPTLLHKTVKRKYQRYGHLEAYFEHFTMATDSMTVPTTFNEAIVTMVGEKATGNASELVIDNPQLVAKKATGKYVAPNELIEDNYTDVELGKLLVEKLEAGFEKKREQQIIAGDGTGQNHTGILNDTAITQSLVMDTGDTKPEDISIDYCLKLRAEVPEMFIAFGAYVMNPRTFDYLLMEKDSNGDYIRQDESRLKVATEAEREKGILGYVWGHKVLSTTFFPAPTGSAQASTKTVLFADLNYLGVVGNKRTRTIKRVTEATLAGVNLAEADATGWIAFERFAWKVIVPTAGAFLVTAAT